MRSPENITRDGSLVARSGGVIIEVPSPSPGPSPGPSA